MGIIINSRGDSKITISGTDITLDSIYVRSRHTADWSGKTLEIEWRTYQSKEKFKENINNVIYTNIQFGNKGMINVPEEYSGRDYLLILLAIASQLEDQGYLVEVEEYDIEDSLE